MAPVGALRLAIRDGHLPAEGLALVACSGGLDSSALVVAMNEVGAWSLVVAAIDHGLRVESAGEVLRVQALAESLGCGFAMARLELSEVSPGAGPQDRARRGRLEALERIADEVGAGVIVTAHHADDQAETLLMRLGDGAGLTGLRGIPARRGRFVRPWLNVSRASIEAFARLRGVSWIEDPSNGDARFRRTRARLAVVEVSARLGRGWVAGAARSAEYLGEDSDALHALGGLWLAEKRVRDPRTGAHGLPVEALQMLPEAARRWALRAMLATIPDRRARTALASALYVLEQGGGLDVGAGWRVAREGAVLWFRPPREGA